MDSDTTLFVLRLLQVILAVPLLAILGQGALWLLARGFGQPPERNFFYKLLELIASPVVRIARWITPRFIPDVRVPLVALSLLAVGYLWTMIEIANVCHRQGLPVAQCLGVG